MTNNTTFTANNNTITNVNIALAMPGRKKSLLLLATIENIDLAAIKTRYDNVDDVYGNGYPFHMEDNKLLAKVRGEIFQSLFEINNNDIIGIEDIKTANAKALVFRNGLRLIIGQEFSSYDIKNEYKEFLDASKCVCAIEEIVFNASEIRDLKEEVVYITSRAAEEIDSVILAEERR